MKSAIAWVFFGVVVVAGAQAPGSAAKALPAGIQVEAVPAMWKVAGEDGSGSQATVYLFGSVHVMRKEVHWETAKVAAAFKASDAAYFEISDLGPDAVKAMQPMIMQMGMDMEHPLSTRIPKADVDLLDTEAKKLGLPGAETFEPMKPWLVYLTLSVLPAMQAGYDPNGGIDQALMAEAKTQHKRVKGFESAEQQLHYLADFPLDQQVMLLHQTLVDLPKSEAETDEIVGDWTHGDVDKIAALDNDEMKVKTPVLYDKLLVKRNEQFAGDIAAILKDPAEGTVFVTVGAAHLAGPDSVVAMLAKKGFVATRVE